MSSYTQLEDIESEFKDASYDQDTAVTSDDICEFIRQEEALLNAQIATVYSTPVTGTIATAILKKLSTMLVKARVVDLMQVKSGNVDTEQGAAGDYLREQVAEILKKIIDKELLLIDATLNESSGGVKSYSSENSTDHLFERDTEQW